MSVLISYIVTSQNNETEVSKGPKILSLHSWFETIKTKLSKRPRMLAFHSCVECNTTEVNKGPRIVSFA